MDEHQLLLNDLPSNNPYIEGLKMIFLRLKYDLNPAFWHSRKLLKKVQNHYQGQKAVIVCNGPSLAKTDLSLLGEVFTFGMNKINLFFERNDFRPSCILASDRYIIESNADFFNQTEIPLYLSHYGLAYVKPRSTTCFLHETSYRKFARSLNMSYHAGFTVTYLAIQLAYHMGFKQVALIGCDHNFVLPNQPTDRLLTATEGNDVNHFVPNYYKKGELFGPPNLVEMEYAFGLARNIYHASGRELYNCTMGGKLELFPRMELQAFLEGK